MSSFGVILLILFKKQLDNVGFLLFLKLLNGWVMPKEARRVRKKPEGSQMEGK